MRNYLNHSKIKFKYLKSSSGTDTIVDMFMSDWLSDVCHSRYDVKDGVIDFEVQEDAIIAKLKGIPPTLTNYIMYEP